MIRFGFLVLMLLLPAAACGEEPATVRAAISAPAVYVGDTLIYSIEVENAEPDSPPDFPDQADFETHFLNQQNKSFSSTVIVNGEVSQTSVVSYVLYYRITPLRPGEFSVPEVEVRAGDAVLRTQPVPFRVVGASERDDLQVKLIASSDTPYVGQPIEVRLEVLVERGSSLNNAVFNLPGLDERFSMQDTQRSGPRRSRSGFEFLGAPAQVRVEQFTQDGVAYDRLTTSRTIVASEPGEFTLGPGVWICEFTPPRARRGARVAVPSNELLLQVQALPAEGRPSRFSGLIGQYRVSASAAPTEVRVGDPIRFELTLEGPGDLRRIAAPELAGIPGFDSGFRLANRDAERQLGDGRVTFRYVLRAITDVVDAIPSVVLNSFDPELGEYERIETDPIPLRVQPSQVVTAVDGEAFSAPATEAQRVESAPRTLAANREGAALVRKGGATLAQTIRSPVVVALVAAPPAAYFGLLAVFAVRRRHERPQQAYDQRTAARRAMSNLRNDGTPHHDAIRSALIRYEALRSARPEQVVTPGEAVERIRIERTDLADRASSLLERCESARFGGRDGACEDRHRSDALAMFSELSKGAKP